MRRRVSGPASRNGFSYQWSRCNSNGSSCANISGATGQSYGVGQADLRMALRVNVTAKNSTGSTMATSAASVIGQRSYRQVRRPAPHRPGGQPPEGHDALRRGALHRQGHRQDPQVDAVVLEPQRPRDRRPPEQGRPRRERRGVQVALPPVLVARSRHADADRIPARRVPARPGIRQRPTTRNTQGEIRGQIRRVS